MPDAIVKILKLTPFYYMQNVSFNIYNGYITDMKEIVKIIILQLIWFVILSILGKKMMNKQKKKSRSKWRIERRKKNETLF